MGKRKFKECPIAPAKTSKREKMPSMSAEIDDLFEEINLALNSKLPSPLIPPLKHKLLELQICL